MTSDYELIGKGEGYAQKVYEDDMFVAFIQEKAIVPGQITIIPRKKYTIFEMLPSSMLGMLSVVIKKVSEAVFETLKCHGTNVLIENGISAGQDQPVMSVHVIPRFTDDEVVLEWEAKQLTEFDMEDSMVHLTENKIRLGDDIVISGKKATDGLGVEKYDDSEESKEDGLNGINDKSKNSKKTIEMENYLIRSLRKIP